MKSFNSYLTESASKGAETAETDLALLLEFLNDNSKMSSIDAMNQLIEDGTAIGKYPKQVSNMADRIRKVETTFKWVAQTDNKRFSDNLKKYNMSGKGSKKTDVIFTGGSGKVYRISVKLDGAVVLFSSDSKKNFETFFNSGLSAYIKDFPNDKDVDKFSIGMKRISDEIIGKKLNRILNEFNGENSPEKIKEKIKKKHKFKDGDLDKFNVAVDNMISEQIEISKTLVNDAIDEYTDWMQGDARNKGVEFVTNAFNSNDTLKRYIVFEAATGSATFGKDSDAVANWILSPSKFEPIETPDSKVIHSLAKAMKVDFRGLPDKSGSYPRVKKLLNNKLSNKDYFNMKLGLKLDIKENLEEGIADFFVRIFKTIVSKISKIVNKINIRINKVFKDIKNTYPRYKNVAEIIEDVNVYPVISGKGKL